MAVSKQTMTDEQRKSVIVEYLKAFDKAGVNTDGGSILDLFSETHRSISRNGASPTARRRSDRCSAISAPR